jgi:uncharacterized membrane protein
MIRGFGIQGAAFVWMIRAMIDSTLLYLLARRLLDQSAQLISWHRMFFLYVAFGILVLAAFVRVHLSVKLISLVIIFLIHAGTAWVMFLDQDEKKMVKNLLFSAGSRNA